MAAYELGSSPTAFVHKLVLASWMHLTIMHELLNYLAGGSSFVLFAARWSSACSPIPLKYEVMYLEKDTSNRLQVKTFFFFLALTTFFLAKLQRPV